MLLKDAIYQASRQYILINSGHDEQGLKDLIHKIYLENKITYKLTAFVRRLLKDDK